MPSRISDHLESRRRQQRHNPDFEMESGFLSPWFGRGPSKGKHERSIDQMKKDIHDTFRGIHTKRLADGGVPSPFNPVDPQGRPSLVDVKSGLPRSWLENLDDFQKMWPEISGAAGEAAKRGVKRFEDLRKKMGYEVGGPVSDSINPDTSTQDDEEVRRRASSPFEYWRGRRMPFTWEGMRRRLESDAPSNLPSASDPTSQYSNDPVLRYQQEANTSQEEKDRRFKEQLRFAAGDPSVFQKTRDETRDWLKAIGRNVGSIPASDWWQGAKNAAYFFPRGIYDMFNEASEGDPKIQKIRENPKLLEEFLNKKQPWLENDTSPMGWHRGMNYMTKLLSNEDRKTGVGSPEFARNLVTGINSAAGVNPVLFSATLPERMQDIIRYGSSVGDWFNHGTPPHKGWSYGPAEAAGLASMFKFGRGLQRGSLNLPAYGNPAELGRYVGSGVAKKAHDIVPGAFTNPELGGVHSREWLPWRQQSQFTDVPSLRRSMLEEGTTGTGWQLKPVPLMEQPYSKSAFSYGLGSLGPPVNWFKQPVRYQLGDVSLKEGEHAGKSLLFKGVSGAPQGKNPHYIDITPYGGGEVLQINPVGFSREFFTGPKGPENMQKLIATIASDPRFSKAQHIWPINLAGKEGNWHYRHPGGNIYDPTVIGEKNYNKAQSYYDRTNIPKWDDIRTGKVQPRETPPTMPPAKEGGDNFFTRMLSRINPRPQMAPEEYAQTGRAFEQLRPSSGDALLSAAEQNDGAWRKAISMYGGEAYVPDRIRELLGRKDGGKIGFQDGGFQKMNHEFQTRAVQGFGPWIGGASLGLASHITPPLKNISPYLVRGYDKIMRQILPNKLHYEDPQSILDEIETETTVRRGERASGGRINYSNGGRVETFAPFWDRPEDTSAVIWS